MGSNKIYIKLIDVKHEEIQEFLNVLRDKYKVVIECNKDTYSVLEASKEMYLEILDMKNDYGRLGKLVMIYKGGL